MWQWRPIAEPVVWRVEGAGATILQAVFWLGWAVLLIRTFLINHFELFGLRQAFARLTGRAVPEPEFRTPSTRTCATRSTWDSSSASGRRRS
jgi:hypothetical protein